MASPQQSTGSAGSVHTVGAARLAGLVDDFDRSPAYVGLADALATLITEGRLGRDERLPSERELSLALGVSRTTVTRAYARLQESGYARARQGAGTFTRVPAAARRAHDAFLTPSADVGLLDLTCAATPSAPGVADAVRRAHETLPGHLGGHGYYPAGLPQLRTALAEHHTRDGLPTRPEQIVVTPGALAGASLVFRALLRRGDRVLVENPTYPNAVDALRHEGARVFASDLDREGWDLDAVRADVRRSRPRLAYLVPDFHNPTGHLMRDDQRAAYADALRSVGAVAVVDEAHRDLAFDPLGAAPMPRRFAAHAPSAISLGSASKRWWGGLRMGWVRVPDPAMVEVLLRARMWRDLGAPVLEQLVLLHLLEAEASGAGRRAEHLARLRTQRDALTRAVGDLLPDWTYRLPGGGLALWCRLPRRGSTALAAAAVGAGVALPPGPVFAVTGGLDDCVRLPWTLPAEDLVEAVARLARCWADLPHAQPAPRDPPVVVA